MSAERVLNTLLQRLWAIYCRRVEYARRYTELVESRGGRVVNDHIAFRTFNTRTGAQPPGMAAIERVFMPLGYRPAGSYVFKDTHLSARHYQHPDPLAPKIFISQLEVEALPPDVAAEIRQAVGDAEDRLDASVLSRLQQADSLDETERAPLLDQLVSFFTSLPWSPPKAALVPQINKLSQYAAWTLLHGNNVNHFTACINEQNVPDWPDLEATVAALRQAGIPMKNEIEGAPHSKLRQTATQAVDVDCPVRDATGHPATIRWAYAYYELAERGDIIDATGHHTRFQGFLGPQAAQLFEMTRR